MNISPDEAEEALAAIQKMTQKTRHSIANSGVYITLIATGMVWLIGFMATQFLTGDIVIYIWIVASLLGAALATLLGFRMGKRVRSPETPVMAKRIGLFWLFLILFALATILIAKPTDGKQMSMLIILFIMLGQMAMGLVFSFSSTWWALLVAALALIGYYFIPDYYYLWIAILGGGGMILLGLYIRYRW